MVIDKSKLLVSLKYIPKVGNAQTAGHQMIDENYNLGKTLIANSDCKACHQLNAKSVGPSFAAVSTRYKMDKNAVGYLANKIITGGGGVWGEHAMSAHPQLSKEEASEMVKYVLSVTEKGAEARLPQQGTVLLNQHPGTGEEGRYILTAAYTDKGGAVGPLTRRDALYLRPAKVQVEQADRVYNMHQGDSQLGRIHNGSYFVLKGIDLKDVTRLTYRYSSQERDASIKVRVDSIKGPVISSLDYVPTGDWNTFKEATTEINDPGGKHDLYFQFVRVDTPNRHLASLDWVRFEGGKEVVEAPKPAVAKSTKSEKAPAAKTTEIRPVSSKNAIATGKALIAKSDCRTCHAMNEKLVGPSLLQVANRYKNTPAVVSRLTGKIINGGAGAWGQVPMTPHPQLSKTEAASMVQYILSLRK
jgi:cytochrome c